MPSAEPRPYGGRSAEDRRSARRDRLIAAGIELMGSRGAAELSLRALLREAGLAARYFRESFADLDAFRIAVFDVVSADVGRAIRRALRDAPDDFESRVRIGLRAYAEATTADPRRARIQLLEWSTAGPRLREHAWEILRQSTLIIVPRRGQRVDGLRSDVLAYGLVGAVSSMLAEWFEGRLDVTLEELVEHWVALFSTLDGATGAEAQTAATATPDDGHRPDAQVDAR